MRSVGITCVKNEIDIIEPFVRHTLAIVDRLTVLDNGSTDGTCDVLRALEKEGLPLRIVEDPSLGKYQSGRLTRLMRDAVTGRDDADWVVPLDADEFLVISEGSSLVPHEGAGERPVALPWRGYVPDDNDDRLEPNPVLRIRHRRVADGWEPAKLLVPRRLAALPTAVLLQGSHDLLVGGRPCEPRSHGGACLAHFPIRSPGQYAAKTAINSLQYQVMSDRDWACGSHYGDPFALLKRDLHAFAASVAEAARRYSLPPGAAIEPETLLDPIPYRGGPLRYTPRADDLSRAWQSLLLYAEQLARQHAVLTASLTEDERLWWQQQASFVASLHSQLADQQRELVSCRAMSWQRQREMQRRLSRAEQELRRSWTWRIGRLLVGPVAWVNRFPRRCAQALVRALCSTPRLQGKGAELVPGRADRPPGCDHRPGLFGPFSFRSAGSAPPEATTSRSTSSGARPRSSRS